MNKHILPITYDEAVIDIGAEMRRALAKFPPFNSPHEGLAVILEDYEELKTEVFKQHDVRNNELMRKEAMQVATMAIRFMIDLT